MDRGYRMDPHWMFSRYPLKFLEDPKEEFGDSEHIEAIATKDSLRKIHMQPLFQEL